MLHFTLSKLTFTLCISLDSSKQLKQFNDVLFKGRVDNLIKRQGQKVSGHMLPRDLVCRSRGLLILTKEIVLHRFSFDHVYVARYDCWQHLFSLRV